MGFGLVVFVCFLLICFVFIASWYTMLAFFILSKCKELREKSCPGDSTSVIPLSFLKYIPDGC